MAMVGKNQVIAQGNAKNVQRHHRTYGRLTVRTAGPSDAGWMIMSHNDAGDLGAQQTAPQLGRDDAVIGRQRIAFLHPNQPIHGVEGQQQKSLVSAAKIRAHQIMRDAHFRIPFDISHAFHATEVFDG